MAERPILKFIKRTSWAIALALITSSCSWNTQDKTLFTGYMAMSAYDYMQTQQAASEGLQEGNGLYRSSDGTADMLSLAVGKLLVTGFLFWLLEENPRYRKSTLFMVNGVQGGVVGWNANQLNNARNNARSKSK